MKDVHCEIFDQKINQKQCYLKRDPSAYYKNRFCIECPQYKGIILSKVQQVDSQSIKKNTSLTPKTLSEKISSKQISKRQTLKDKAEKKIFGQEREISPKVFRLGDIIREINEQSFLARLPKPQFTHNLEREEYLQNIFQILSLHDSFWQAKEFLFWQILRLNKKPQRRPSPTEYFERTAQYHLSGDLHEPISA